MTNDDGCGAAACYGADAVADVVRPVALRTLRGRTGTPPLQTLVSTIEGEIVPRLMLARRGAVAVADDALDRAIHPTDVDELVRLLVRHDAAVATAFVGALAARGTSLDVLCLALLAPAARKLGRMWEDDEVDFATVTVGLCHLHTVLRDIGRARPVEAGRGAQHTVLLVPVPGEQHTFGLLMVGEFFRRHGWSVATEYPQSTAAMLELVDANRYAVVGLTVGCREQLDGLSARIAQLRRASRNKSVGVMVGGRLFAAQPELAGRLGADATAGDARDAALQADRIVSLLG
jgi:methanogenic corrinoid protein MtbC1